MREKLVPSAPVFRSKGQAAVLQALRYATSALSLTELAARTGLVPSAVHTEVERLEAAGMVRSDRVGRTRLVTLDDTSPVASEIRGLVDKLLGVEVLLATALEPLEGIDVAMIFGSWAARRRDIAGPEPADVDLLVVGDVDADDVFQAIGAVEPIIGRPVNAVLRTSDEWQSEASGFARSVREGPTIVLLDRTRV